MNQPIRCPDPSEALKVFQDQAVTISMKGNEIKLQCDCNAEAEAIFKWLTDMGQPDELEGNPIGWTIVATGLDGSVLCQAPHGQRARYWFTEERQEEAGPDDDNESLTYEWLFAQPRETMGGNQFFSGLLCFDWDDPVVHVSYYVKSRDQYYPIRRIRTRGEYRLLRKALNKIDLQPEDFGRVVSMSSFPDAFQHDARQIMGDSNIKEIK